MVFKDEQEVFKYIRKHQTAHKWVDEARKNHKVLKALVFGKDFHEVLIRQIEKIESAARAEARKRYSKDIRDMFDRVMQPRTSIFSASGGSVESNISSKQNKTKFLKHLTHFKGQKSIKKYLSEVFFRLEDTDPNGLIFMEYFKDENIFPTYKSINDIRDYISNGQLLEVVLFEPKTIVHKTRGTWIEWRVVDDKKDWRIKEQAGTFTVIEDLTFEHPFGKVPGIILSDHQKMGSELRISPLFPVEELSKDYARDKSIKTIYKFQHGFPRHWRYVKECRPCQGTGKNGTEQCLVCDGKGEIQRNDITDVQTIALPREDDPIITPNVEGFVAPDLATWERFNEDMRDMEDLIESTMWGTRRLREGGNETATGRFIDVQPVMNKLGIFTDNVEWVHNRLANWVLDWVNGKAQKEELFHITYGRRFIIESPDIILERYTESRIKGDNNTILDKQLDEYILSKYQTNPLLLEEMQKKRLVEPYIHQSIKEVNDIFGAAEADKIVLFVDFWETADISKSAEELKVDFEAFIKADAERKGLTEIEKTRKLLDNQGALIGAAILRAMSPKQILELVGLEEDREFKEAQKLLNKSGPSTE